MNACFVSVGFVNWMTLAAFAVRIIGGLIPVEADHLYVLSTSIIVISVWLAGVFGGVFSVCSAFSFCSVVSVYSAVLFCSDPGLFWRLCTISFAIWLGLSFSFCSAPDSISDFSDSDSLKCTVNATATSTTAAMPAMIAILEVRFN